VGEHLPALERRADQGLPTPAIDNRPELYEDLADVWTAFVALHATRPLGFGPGPISFTEIEAWLRLHGITRPGDKEDYAYLIRALDRTWLRQQAQHGETDPHR
jgi:hypothetical protein